jgi:GNAT superfamily N-acetyltransferase
LIGIRAPPGTKTDDWLTTMRSGMWRLYFRLTAGGRHRLFGDLLPRLHHAMDDVLGAHAAECYYLVYLGTKPSGRRRGYAKKLIEAMAVKVKFP